MDLARDPLIPRDPAVQLPLVEPEAAFRSTSRWRARMVECSSRVASGQRPGDEGKFLNWMVARGGIEPPTRGFSVQVPKRPKSLKMHTKTTSTVSNILLRYGQLTP